MAAMVRQLASGGFAVASRGCWLPGVYATRQAATWAAHFPDGELQRLADDICRGQKRAIISGGLRRLCITARLAAR